MRTGAGGRVGRRRGPGAPRGNVRESAQAGHAPPTPFLPGLCGALASLAPRRIARRFLQPSGWAQGGAPYRPPPVLPAGGAEYSAVEDADGDQERGRAWTCSRSGPSPATRRWRRGLTASRRRPGIRARRRGPAPRWRLGRLMVARYASRSAGRGRGLRRGGRPAGIAPPRGETDRRKPADARPFLRAVPGGDHLPSRRQPVPSSVSRTWASRSAAVSHSMIHSPT